MSVKPIPDEMLTQLYDSLRTQVVPDPKLSGLLMARPLAAEYADELRREMVKRRLGSTIERPSRSVAKAPVVAFKMLQVSIRSTLRILLLGGAGYAMAQKLYSPRC